MLRRQDSIIFGGNQVVESGKELLLAEDYESHWAGLWATGGAGKTLAAQRIFNDSSIQAHFTGGCYWLTVGKAKSVRKLLFMLQDAILHPIQRQPAATYYSNEDLKNSISNKLRDRQSALLVLDDVWEEETLLALDVLPRAPNAGCRVLVTTRNQDILDKRHAHKIQVPLLGRDDSWQLFCWHACRGVLRMPVELREVAKQITEECKGLPLALKVIGGVFSGKTDMKVRNWEGFWKLSLEKLKNADILSPEHEVQLYLRLKLSVDELDDIDPHLRDCFLYFAAFPEDENVDLSKDLLPLWLGDRIVGTHADYDPKDEAFRLLGWLISRSLIELHSQPGLHNLRKDYLTCKVHDVLRDLARYVLQHKVPVGKRLCLYESGRDLKALPDGWVPASKDNKKMDPTEISARRLSIMSSHLEKLPPRLVDAPNLQVMMLRDNPINAIPDGFFFNLSNLTVLELSRCSLKSLPNSLKTLKSLLVLNLRNNNELLMLPSSLGSLTNLEMLNLDSCKKLAYLPSSFSLLTKLQYLNLRGNFSMWPDAGSIRNWFSGRGALKDLNHLVQLKELDILSDSHTALPVGLEKALTKLQALRLTFTKLTALPETLGDDLQHLKVLELPRCESLTSLPTSLVSLQNLQTLRLSCCSGLLSLPPLDGLPSLVCLDLSDCCNLQSLPDTFNMPGSFPALKELTMYGCTSIASFPELQPGAMPQLEILELSYWTQLVQFPKPLGNLATLRYLSIAGCGMQTLEDLDSAGDLQNFSDLEELVVKSCQKLSQLPASLASLPRLRKIHNRDCPANVPAELLHLVRK
ncbi:unnamed protein product [Calypogeia fissa]